MGVTIRGTKFHYRFRLHGQEYSGPCPGITVPQTAKAGEISVLRRRAVSYEAGVRLQAEKELAEKARQDEEIRRNRTVRALVENYRYELTGGRPVPVAQAYEIAVAKPSRRQAISRFAELKFTGHAGCIDEFLHCVKRGGTPQTASSDNIRSFAMVEGAIRSAETGKEVSIAI